jgi:hypothetical protein
VVIWPWYIQFGFVPVAAVLTCSTMCIPMLVAARSVVTCCWFCFRVCDCRVLYQAVRPRRFV